jgi:hypothetical protein
VECSARDEETEPLANAHRSAIRPERRCGLEKPLSAFYKQAGGAFRSGKDRVLLSDVRSSPSSVAHRRRFAALAWFQRLIRELPFDMGPAALAPACAGMWCRDTIRYDFLDFSRSPILVGLSQFTRSSLDSGSRCQLWKHIAIPREVVRQ